MARRKVVVRGDRLIHGCTASVFREYGTQLAPISGSMTYGVPSAVAATIARPGAHRALMLGRRLLPDERAGARNGDPVSREPKGRSVSSSTTGCTARPGCIRSANSDAHER